jgi:hypothetical protein
VGVCGWVMGVGLSMVAARARISYDHGLSYITIVVAVVSSGQLE